MSKSLAAVITAMTLTAAGCGVGSSDDASQTITDGTETTIASATPEADGSVDGSAGESDSSTDDSAGDDNAADSSSEDSSAGSNAGGGTFAIGGASVTLGDSILAGTLDPAADTSSARFNGTINIVGAADSELPGNLSMSFDGAYDINANSSDVTVDFGDLFSAAIAADPEAAEAALFADFFEEPIRVVTIDDTSYIQWGLLNLFAGGSADGDVWLETPADESSDLASSFTGGFGGAFGTGESPTEFLDQLRNANAVIEDLGREDVQGNSTTHYRALVDTQALAETLPADERAEFIDSFGSQTEFPMDFWVGDDGLLYRYVIDFPAEALAEDGDGIESLSVTYEIFDYGQDVNITAPPADQIISDDVLGGFGLDD